MGEEALVSGADECLVAEVARGQDAIVQAAAVNLYHLHLAQSLLAMYSARQLVLKHMSFFFHFLFYSISVRRTSIKREFFPLFVTIFRLSFYYTLIFFSDWTDIIQVITMHIENFSITK